ncbi:unnamed protein product [Schistocephalus solidus]|uniref:WD repeat-containing protein 79 n=1 Tax=Schistocephalus solidus TaxID=70667 RepID=A0A3P7EDH9_SCHSO|nr:unnamed protein product [Schistocephalus solidus]
MECGDISDNGPVTETSRVEIGALSQPLEPDFVIKDRQHTSKAEDNTSESYDTTQSEFEGSPEDLSDIPKVKHYDWTSSKPKLFVRVEDEFKRYATKLPLGSNYLRGCLWSPDGTCLLTNSCDNVFRVFEFPPALTPNPMDYDLELNLMEPDTLPAVLWMREPELIYDYCWFPGMKTTDPITCCFASTSRRTPVHLWDAFTGTLRASYRPFNHMGESIAAQSIAFSTDGQLLYCGFNRFVQVFHVCRPGSQSERRPRLGQKPDQGGIISCLASHQCGARGLYAAGSFSGSVGVYTEPGRQIALVEGPRSGVSQVAFAEPVNAGSSWYLIAGGRVDSQIFVWDGRWMASPLVVLHRRVENYQRFQFGLDATGRYLFTGSQTGVVSIFDFTSPTVGVGEKEPATMFPVSVWRAHLDSCHGLSVHPTLPVVATTSGQKRPSSALPSNGRRKGKPAADLLPSPKRLCERCKSAEPVKAEENIAPNLTPPSSDSESDSASEAQLTEDDAISSAMLVGPQLDRMPLEGCLYRLPIRNELALWAFPKGSREQA